MSDDYRDEAREIVRQGQWTFWHVFPRLLLAVGFIASIGFGLNSLGMFGKAAVGRAVFEQTQSFVHGKNTYIARLRLQYEVETADATTKESLRRLIIEEAETIDFDKLSTSNQLFISKLR